MTDRGITGMLAAMSVVYGALGVLSGVAAALWIEGISAIPAVLSATLFLVGSFAIACCAIALRDN